MGVVVRHAADGEFAAFHRGVILGRRIIHRKDRLHQLLVQVAGIDSHVVHMEQIVQTHRKVVGGHKGSVVVGELEPDGDLFAVHFGGQDAVDVAVIGHAVVAFLVVIPLQMPGTGVALAVVVGEGQVLGQVHDNVALVIYDLILFRGLSNEPIVYFRRQLDVEAGGGQARTSGRLYLVAVHIGNHAVIAIAAGVDGDVGGGDGDGARTFSSVGVDKVRDRGNASANSALSLNHLFTISSHQGGAVTVFHGGRKVLIRSLCNDVGHTVWNSVDGNRFTVCQLDRFATGNSAGFNAPLCEEVGICAAVAERDGKVKLLTEDLGIRGAVDRLGDSQRTRFRIGLIDGVAHGGLRERLGQTGNSVGVHRVQNGFAVGVQAVIFLTAVSVIVPVGVGRRLGVDQLDGVGELNFGILCNGDICGPDKVLVARLAAGNIGQLVIITAGAVGHEAVC